MATSDVVRDYLNNTDFLAFRYLNNQNVGLLRKLCWISLFLGAFVSFVLFSVDRLGYYYSYPYHVKVDVQQEMIPLPEILICPTYDRPVVTPDYDSIQRMSAAEVIYMAALGYGLHIVNMSVENQSRLHVDSTVLNAIREIPTHNLTVAKKFVIDTLSNFHDSYHTFGITLYNFQRSTQSVEAYLNVLKAVQMLSNESYINYTLADTRSFLWKFGLSQDSIQSCTFETSGIDLNCVDRFRVSFEEVNGICLHLQQLGRTRMMFNRSDIDHIDHRLHVVFKDFSAPGGKFAKLHVYLMHENKFMFGQELNEETKNFQFDIEEVRTMKRLSSPYHKIACRDYGAPNDAYASRYDCIEDCVDKELQNRECIYFFLSINASSEVGRKPMCAINRQLQDEVIYSQRAECMKQCQRSCTETGIKFSAPGKGVNQNYGFSVDLTFPQEYVSHLFYEEEPLYKVGSLLAEIGGTMGLFIGASTFTLLHVLELSWLMLVSPLRDKLK